MKEKNDVLVRKGYGEVIGANAREGRRGNSRLLIMERDGFGNRRSNKWDLLVAPREKTD